MNTLQGKVTLITGAKGGLGSFVTEAFLAAGAKVVGVSRSIQANDFLHPEFTALPAELSSGEAARKLAGELVARFGRIDALVHVMGGFAGGKSVAETDDATFEKMLDLNYRAAFFIARAVLPQMRQQGGGRILAVSEQPRGDGGMADGRVHGRQVESSRHHLPHGGIVDLQLGRRAELRIARAGWPAPPRRVPGSSGSSGARSGFRSRPRRSP